MARGSAARSQPQRHPGFVPQAPGIYTESRAHPLESLAVIGTAAAV
jgi:hypothetical protein